jgi:hypothetical protein
MIPKCTPTLGDALMRKLQMFRALVEKTNKHQLGPHDTIKNLLKQKCLKFPCIVHLYMICMSYDIKKKRWESNWEFDS